MFEMLLAYDAAGAVVGTLDYLTIYDEDGAPLGLVDFAAHEEAGGEVTDFWRVSNATGSKIWPEFLGVGARDFRVELAGPPGHKHIAALVHKTSGHRRERAVIEAAIADRIANAVNGVANIRDLTGNQDHPLLLDDEGRTRPRDTVKRPTLPLVGVRP